MTMLIKRIIEVLRKESGDLDGHQNFIQSVKTGFKKGVETLLFLAKIIIPVYIIVTIMKHTPIMDFLSRSLSGVMGVFNLPGEGAIPFVTGIFTDEYGAIAAMNAIDLTKGQITTIAMMVLFFHTIFIEMALKKKLGLSGTFFFILRLVLAIVVGIGVGLIGGLL